MGYRGVIQDLCVCLLGLVVVVVRGVKEGGRAVEECKDVLSSAWLEARGRRCAPSQRIFFSDNDT